MSKDDQQVILLENGRFCFFKSVALQGFFDPKHGYKSNISSLKVLCYALRMN